MQPPQSPSAIGLWQTPALLGKRKEAEPDTISGLEEYGKCIRDQIRSRCEPCVVSITPHSIESAASLRAAVEELLKTKEIVAFALAADGLTHLVKVKDEDRPHATFEAITSWFSLNSPAPKLPLAESAQSPNPALTVALKAAVPKGAIDRPSARQIPHRDLMAFVGQLANAVKDVHSEIHTLSQELEDLKETYKAKFAGFKTKLLTFLTSKRLKENAQLCAAVHSFFAKNKDFFPLLTLRAPDGSSFQIPEILACTLSDYCLTKCERWNSEGGNPVIEINTAPITFCPNSFSTLRAIFEGASFDKIGTSVDFREMLCLVNFLRMTLFQKKCRDKLTCEGFDDLKKLIPLCLHLNDAELKVRCLLFLQSENFTYPQALPIPDEFKKLMTAFQNLIKSGNRIQFNFPPQQRYPGYTRPSYFTATIDELTDEALAFCALLEVEEIQTVEKPTFYDAYKFNPFKSLFLSVYLRSEECPVEDLLSLPKLENLNLNNCIFDPGSASRFLKRLATNKVVKSLTISHTLLFPEMIDEFLEALTSNRTLEFLVINEPKNKEAAEKLSRALRQNTSLRVVNFSNSRLHKDWNQRLKDRPVPLYIGSPIE